MVNPKLQFLVRVENDAMTVGPCIAYTRGPQDEISDGGDEDFQD